MSEDEGKTKKFRRKRDISSAMRGSEKKTVEPAGSRAGFEPFATRARTFQRPFHQARVS